MERFKVGDLVEYNSKIDEGATKSFGLVLEIERFFLGATALVRWVNHPHADVIGDTLQYDCVELKPVENRKTKNVE